MENIKERAEAYADKQVNIGTQALCRIEGYIVGATEQKAIDIDKACEWFRRETPCGIGGFSVDAIIERFRKAMEE